MVEDLRKDLGRPISQFPQVVEQVLGGPKIPNRDRILHVTVEKILVVPVPEMVKQLMKLPKTVSEDGIQQRTVERIADIPMPQVAEELEEAIKIFSQNRVQQRFGRQTIKTPGVSLAEKIVQMPVTHTCVAYAGDEKIARKDLVVTRLTRLSLTLDFPASQFSGMFRRP